MAITGPSGGGKTSSVKVMLGLLTPTTGELLVGGVRIERVGLGAFRRMIGSTASSSSRAPSWREAPVVYQYNLFVVRKDW